MHTEQIDRGIDNLQHILDEAHPPISKPLAWKVEQGVKLVLADGYYVIPSIFAGFL